MTYVFSKEETSSTLTVQCQQWYLPQKALIGEKLFTVKKKSDFERTYQIFPIEDESGDFLSIVVDNYSSKYLEIERYRSAGESLWKKTVNSNDNVRLKLHSTKFVVVEFEIRHLGARGKDYKYKFFNLVDGSCNHTVEVNGEFFNTREIQISDGRMAIHGNNRKLMPEILVFDITTGEKLLILSEMFDELTSSGISGIFSFRLDKLSICCVAVTGVLFYLMLQPLTQQTRVHKPLLKHPCRRKTVIKKTVIRKTVKHTVRKRVRISGENQRKATSSEKSSKSRGILHPFPSLKEFLNL